ncbi:hypothetical protein [Vibrio sp. SCSIO 43136]|uniref:hypothetical protein n=1 Tax=Vibrio sp. SCSIO 43136 TaxID=2819101 RepID=UPI002074C33C|nr:hypothetical protein [Vibrio sp. SCSIO 43136]USD68107.1 hypothetical protein J4N39_18200 [Vibrio sp. SCSIO 43136]
MERHEVEFDINYAYTLELYHRNFYTRANNIIALLQVFLGSMVFADVSGYWLYGAFISLLTIIALIYNPAGRAAIAKQQVEVLGQLKINQSQHTDESLSLAYAELTKGTSEILGTFKDPAFNRACIMQGSYDDVVQLTKFEAVMAWLAGDLPRK